MNGMKKIGCIVACTGVMSAVAGADVVGEWEVGTGGFASTAIFQFGNLNQYVFTINHDGDTSGRDAFDIIESALPDIFEAEIETYSFGDALVGVAIGDDQDSGFGTPPDYLDYWHYWTRESSDAAWESSMIGFSDRMLTDGSEDGWVFDSDAAPVPAAPVWFAALGAGITRRRRN